jgi:inorganic triphosphatase YgiF
MSYNDREFEIKFSTDSAGLLAAWNSQLLAGAATPSGQTLKSIYYDTAQGDLMRRGMTLRLRRAGRGAPVLTFKWSAPVTEGPFSRGEIQARHPGADLDINLLGEPVAAELREAIGDRKLEPQFETKFKRRLRRLTIGGAQFDAAFDEGEIVAGGRRAPVRELELELKAGDHSDFYEFATQLAEALPLQLETLSKSRRGFLLRADARPYPVKARETQIPADASFDDAVALVIGDTLQHFLANWASLRDDVHPEAIHQMRVALRRLRALLALFHREAPCADFVAFRAEAKRIANALGPARECDAFAGLVASGPRAQFGASKTFIALDALIDSRRAALHEESRRLIAAPACAHFVLRLQVFLVTRGWRNALLADQLPRLTQSARGFAKKALDRLRKRATARGRGLAALPDDQRHELRIALKNLRYAAEFFGGLFAGPQELRTYLRPIARLQDLLGAHNDVACARSFLDHVNAAECAETAFAAGAVLGWFAGGAAVADRDLMQAWKAFKGAETFWS